MGCGGGFDCSDDVGCMPSVPGATPGNIAVFDGNGNVVDSGIPISAVGSGVGTTYTPSITINSGASGYSSQTGIYNGTNGGSSGVINVSVIFRVTSDGSGNIIDLTISNPVGVAANITPTGFTIVPVSGLGTAGNASSGWFNGITTIGALKIQFESGQPNTEYQVSAAWQYKIA